MCGLVGFIGKGDRDDLAVMTGALRHRGPDSEGLFVDPETGVHLGHRRLAIIDIEGGTQPMWNEDQTVGVVFNGEIYNHRDLRRDLEARGHVFRTDHSDTEVLVHGFEEWREQLPARLNGMFAFAIFDRRRRQLFLARDRFGEKPLYYARQDSLFAFASELSAISEHRGFHTRVRQSSLQKFLAHGFLPAPNAIFEDTWKLPGGCHLSFDCTDGSLRVGRYWQFTLEPDEALAERPEGELVEELRALLFQAVERRLISDVPIGLFLSGGLDSSAVLAGAAQILRADRIRTFTVGFTEPSFDESAHAATVAAAFGTWHELERLDIDAAKTLIPYVLGRLDEPLGDASILPTYLLSRFTRRHVTVALSGDGGDELFAGYDPFAAIPWARLYQGTVPRPLHRLLRRAAEMLPVSHQNMSLDFKIRRTLAGLSYGPEIWNPVWLSPAEPRMIASLMEEPLSAEELYEEAIDLWAASQNKSNVDKTLEFYTNFYLQDGILMKVDRAAMMNSLECRAVFLDNDLVDFCRRLPTRFKYRNGERKYLLRRALDGLIPTQILRRPKKGFGIPLANWLRTVPADPPLYPLPGVRMDQIAAAWADHRSGRADHRLLLWSWLTLQTHPCAAVQLRQEAA
jgi:asparagine synthase (glutamine-hydrolysing)